MTKQQFIKTMKEIVSLHKDGEALNEALRKFEPDFNYMTFSRFESLVMKMLEIAMDDSGGWIAYWLYECDYGTNKKFLNSVTDEHGKKIPFRTLSNLYDCIKTK